MSLFISDALAATSNVASSANPPPNSPFSFIMIAAIFVLFYFMLIRPQNKRAKEHREMINQIKKGDEVVTSGGMVGKVMEIQEQFIKVNLAEGVDVHFQKNAISAVLPKGTLKSL